MKAIVQHKYGSMPCSSQTSGLPYFQRVIYGLRRPRISVRGRDVAGHVEAVGKDVTQFRPGDEVYAEGGVDDLVGGAGVSHRGCLLGEPFPRYPRREPAVGGLRCDPNGARSDRGEPDGQVGGSGQAEPRGVRCVRSSAWAGRRRAGSEQQ